MHHPHQPQPSPTLSPSLAPPRMAVLSFSCGSQAALGFSAISPAAFPSESLPTEQQTPYSRTTVQREISAGLADVTEKLNGLLHDPYKISQFNVKASSFSWL